MNKRKIALLAMSACMIAILAIGGTLAYFTDTDYQTNTFTTGNVAIDLYEDFGDNDDNGIEELFPTTGKDKDGNIINAVEKEVYVKNTGSEDAFVRVHIAIPNILDNGNPNFDASANVLHFNYDKENSIGAGKWDWSKVAKDEKYTGDWNYYEQMIGDDLYNVYVVTYEAALKTNESTVDAMSQVYLDKEVTNKDIEDIKKQLGEQWKIYVAAEATQAQGFDNAHAALDAAFGVPGAYETPIVFTTAAEGDTWVNVD